MGDSHRGARFWRKRPKTLYPDARASLGDLAGFFHDRHWWYPTGPARELYQRVEPQISDQLNDLFRDTYCLIVHFQLYMIGRIAETAIPTIMFFCEDKDARKKAKNTVDEGGLLGQLPGFRTGHQRTEPGVGALIQPASDGSSSTEMISKRSTAATSPSQTRALSGARETSARGSASVNVFNEGFQFEVGGKPNAKSRKNKTTARRRRMRAFLESHDAKSPRKPKRSHSIEESSKDDTSKTSSNREAAQQTLDLIDTSLPLVYLSRTKPIVCIGMPIYAKQASGLVRAATANVVSRGSKCWLLSVSHVFSEQLNVAREAPVDADSDFDLGSESEDEEYHNFVDATSRASVSSPGSVTHASPKSTSSESTASLLEADPAKSLPLSRIETQMQLSPSQTRVQEAVSMSPSSLHPVEDLQAIGFQSRRSSVQDWTLIDIADLDTLDAFQACDNISPPTILSPWQLTDSRMQPILVWTSHGHVAGNLYQDAVLMRLPNSNAFEKLKQAKLISPMVWGDCGAAVFFVGSREPHGFIVASSSDKTIAYITPASKVFTDSGTSWGPPQSSSINKLEQGLETTREIPSSREFGLNCSSTVYLRTPCPLFRSLGEGVDPFRNALQSHYPRVSIEKLKFLQRQFFATPAMEVHWDPTVVSTPHTFLSTLCCASAHLDAILERDVESVETSILRSEVIHLISTNMVQSGRQADDFNLVAVVQLVISETIGADLISQRAHEAGLESMIQFRGGILQVGVGGFLASMIAWSLMASCALREASPRQFAVDYCTSRSTRHYAHHAKIPESPLYRPRLHFGTLKKCSAKQTLDLIENVHEMLDQFLNPLQAQPHHPEGIRYFYNRITTDFPPLNKERNPTRQDYKYEAVRVCAVILATALVQNLPLSQSLHTVGSTIVLGKGGLQANVDSPTSRDRSLLATATAFTGFTSASDYAAGTKLLLHLKRILDASDLSVGWQDMAGVLLWIALTAGAASQSTGSRILEKWFRALSIRTSLLLCFKYPEAIHATYLRMTQLIRALRYPTNATVHRHKLG